MSLSGPLPVIASDPDLSQATDQSAQLPTLGGDLIAPVPLRPLLVAALAGATKDGIVLAVTATAREAEDLTAALGSLLGDDAIGYFPAWETLPHERLSPRSDTSGQRLAVLRRLAHPDPSDPRSGPLRVVVTPVRSLLQPMVSGLGELAPVKLVPGQQASLEEIVTHLVEIGYARVELVERRGEIAVRGGLLDVFPPTDEHPLRIEFWGDEIEEIRYFKAADQRSLATAPDGLWAPPCRELLLTTSVRERARQLASEWPGLHDILGKMAEGITVEGMEALAPALTDRMELLLDYLPRGSKIVACDPERIRARAADLVWTSQEFLEASWVGAAAGGQVPIDLGEAAIRPIAEARAAAAKAELPWWTVTPFAAADTSGPGAAGLGDLDDGVDGDPTPFPVSAEPAPAYRGDTSRALADIRRWLADDWRVVLVTEGHGPARRLAELLRGDGLGARDADLTAPPEAGLAHVTTGLLESGFVWSAV